MIMITLIRPVLMSFLNSDKVKRLVVDLLRKLAEQSDNCLLYTSPSPRDYAASRMPSSA